MRRLPLRLLFPLAIFLSALLAAAVVAAHQLSQIDEQLEELAAERVDIIGTLIATGLAADLRRADLVDARRSLEHLIEHGQLSAVTVVGAEGETLLSASAQSGAPAAAAPSPAALATLRDAVMRSGQPQYRIDGDELISAYPVNVRERTGVVVFTHDLSPVIGRAWKYALTDATLFIAITFAIALGFWLLFRHQFVRRIGELVRVTQSIADGAPLPVRSPYENGRDELQQVEIALARMADRLERKNAKLRSSEMRTRTIIDSALDAIIGFDADGRIIEFNPAASRIFGWSREEALGKPYWEILLPKTNRGMYRDSLFRYLKTGEAKFMGRRNELMAQRADGRVFPMEFTVARADYQDGMLFTVFARDISARRKADETLRMSAAALANMAEGVAVVDALGRVVYVNPAFTRITGYEEAEVLRGRLPPLNDPNVEAEMRESVRRQGSWRGVAWSRRRNGDLYPAMYTIESVRDEADEKKTLFRVVVFTDISQSHVLEERLSHLTNHDALTGLPNRKRFREYLDDALERAERHGRCVAVLLIDLDTFKTINDSLGHDVGDQLLVAVAERLQAQLGEGERLARLGGDEFAKLLDDLDSVDRVAERAERCLRKFDQPFECAGYQLFTSASIGISLYPIDGSDADTLIRNADSALYRAKSRGRNTYQFFSAEMNAQALESLMLVNSLRQAIDNGELSLHYQPLFDLSTEEMAAVEALLRWQHPVRGPIPPDVFIPLAEEHGLIGEIGDWVLLQACRQARRWQQEGKRPIRMAVNLSARQLLNPNISRRIAEVLRETGLDARWLELELTESMVMADPERARKLLTELKAMGLTVAIDDFGTGYSSLAYLKQFPIDYLKIDRSFITGIPFDRDDLTITKTIISMANSLGIRLIAEGVETDQQLRFLKAHGCDEGQGYLLGKPEPAAQLRLH